MADNLFSYTPTQTGVQTQPYISNQRPNNRAAETANAITSLLTSVGKYREEQSKTSYVQASKEVLTAKEWYSNAITQTDDPYEHQQMLLQFKTGVDSIVDGYELDETNALRLKSSVEAFTTSQNVSVGKAVFDKQTKEIDNGVMTLFQGNLDAGAKANAEIAKQAIPTYTGRGTNIDEASQRVFGLYAGAVLETSRLNMGDTTQARKDLLEFVTSFDKKLINKPEYTKALGALDKIDEANKKAFSEVGKAIKNSLEYKSIVLKPEDLKPYLSESEMITYTEKYNEINSKDIYSNHPEESKFPEEFKKKAELYQKLHLSQGEFDKAFEIGASTGVIEPLKGRVESLFSEENPQRFSQEFNVLKAQYDKNPRFVSSLFEGKDKQTFLFTKFLVNNGRPITEGLLKEIKTKGASASKVTIPQDVYKKIPVTHNRIKDIEDIQALTNFVGDPNKALKMWKEDYDTFVTKNLDLHGYTKEFNLSNEEMDKVSEYFVNSFKHLYPEAENYNLIYNKDTDSFFAGIDGHPKFDMKISMNDMVEYNKHLELYKASVDDNWDITYKSAYRLLSKATNAVVGEMAGRWGRSYDFVGETLVKPIWDLLPSGEPKKAPDMSKIKTATQGFPLDEFVRDVYNYFGVDMNVPETLQEKPTNDKLDRAMEELMRLPKYRERYLGESGVIKKPVDGVSADELPSFDITKITQHLKSREGFKDVVYKDSEGFLTAGVGHLLTENEKKVYKLGDKIPQETIDSWLQQDLQKASIAAVNQANELPQEARGLVDALVSVNFQLGEGWRKKFKTAWADLVKGDYDGAIKELKYVNKNSTKKSLWYKQTPKRVEDFVKAIERLK